MVKNVNSIIHIGAYQVTLLLECGHRVNVSKQWHKKADKTIDVKTKKKTNIPTKAMCDFCIKSTDIIHKTKDAYITSETTPEPQFASDNTNNTPTTA